MTRRPDTSFNKKLQLKRPTREDALNAVKCLISYVGDNPNRPGLLKTPERVIKAWEQDWGIGYSDKFIKQQTSSILNGQFDDGAEDYSEMICIQNISVSSHCEHHLAEFNGVAHVAYIPSKGGRILGLSKLSRVVNLFARRLQVQERLTNQIADFIQEHCNPVGVGVVIKATHSCMISRGVHEHNTIATTSALRGEMLTVPDVKAEFYRLVGR